MSLATRSEFYRSACWTGFSKILYTKQFNALLLAVRAGDPVDVQKMLELQETSNDMPFEKNLAFATVWFKLPKESMMHIEA